MYQAEISKFQQLHKQTRVFVTPLLVTACVGIYLAMLSTGVSPIEPSNESMLAWGADFGPSVAFDHEAWRLITSVFLHFGLIRVLFAEFLLDRLFLLPQNVVLLLLRHLFVLELVQVLLGLFALLFGEIGILEFLLNHADERDRVAEALAQRRNIVGRTHGIGLDDSELARDLEQRKES